MANPTYRASGNTAATAGGTSISGVAAPSTTAVGDVLFAYYTGYSAGTFTPTPTLPSGWTLLQSDTQTGAGYTIFGYVAYFVATASGGTNFTFGSSLPATTSGYGCVAGIIGFYGQNSTPVDGSAFAVVPNGTTAASPTATATVSNDTILCLYIDNGNTGAIPSSPNGLTSAVAFTDSSTGTGIRAGYAALSASGTSPSYTSTFGETVNPSSGVFGAMFTVLVKGASSGGVSASAAQADGADTQAATATPIVTASAAQTDGADTQAATATPIIVASATQTDGADTQAANASVGTSVSASAAQTDGADTQAATATPIITASAAQADGADTQVATATPVVTASAAQTDSADTQAATATPVVTASAAQTDSADTQSAHAGPITGVAGSAAQADGADTQTATATPLIVASAAQTDSADAQVGVVYVTFIDANLADLFACQQAAVSQYYTNIKPVPLSFKTFVTSGSWTVPADATAVYVSATAAGGSPFGGAGQQILKKQLAATAGATVSVAISDSVVVAVNGVQQLILTPGGAYGKFQAQARGQNSYIQGFGNGVDSGSPDPALAVILWS